MTIKLLFFCLIISSYVEAQEIKRLIFGLNAGVKFANKNYAIRYTGVYQDQLKNYFNQQNNYQTVRQLLNNKDFQFDSYSDFYRFQPAPVYGANLGFQASKTLSFESDFNFSNIKMLGGYTLIITDPGNLTSQEIYANGNISGKESRFNGRISMNYTSDGEKVKAIIGVSGIINAWRMEENLVELKGSILTNLYSQFNPANNFTTRVRGSSFGYGANIGVQIPFKKEIVMQIVYQPYIIKTEYFETEQNIEALGINYIKPDPKIEHDIMVRFVWK